jgi:hypothetical protein
MWLRNLRKYRPHRKAKVKPNTAIISRQADIARLFCFFLVCLSVQAWAQSSDSLLNSLNDTVEFHLCKAAKEVSFFV